MCSLFMIQGAGQLTAQAPHSSLAGSLSGQEAAGHGPGMGRFWTGRSCGFGSQRDGGHPVAFGYQQLQSVSPNCPAGCCVAVLSPALAGDRSGDPVVETGSHEWGRGV